MSAFGARLLAWHSDPETLQLQARVDRPKVRGRRWPERLLEHQAAADPLVSVRSGPPDAVLDTMEPLPVEVGSSTFVELLRPLYEELV